MKKKKTLMVLLIVLAVLSCLTVVSATPGDKLLNDSSATVHYSEPQVSTDYAYYYEKTGDYAREAYYVPWSIDVTVYYNVTKMYYKEVAANNSSYKLDDFKEDLATIVDNGQISISNIQQIDSNGLMTFDEENVTDLTASLDENSSILTVSFSYDPGISYENEYQANSTIKMIKNIGKMGWIIFLKIGDLDDLDVKNPQLSEKIFRQRVDDFEFEKNE